MEPSAVVGHRVIGPRIYASMSRLRRAIRRTRLTSVTGREIPRVSTMPDESREMSAVSKGDVMFVALVNGNTV